MSKEQLITVDQFRQTYFSRRGFPVSKSYVYRIIREYEGKVTKKSGELVIRPTLPFKYKEVGKGIMIVK